MSISLLSGSHQPYGLLSNHAFIRMSIDGVTYNSVTEYVYGNFFTTEWCRERMMKTSRHHYRIVLQILQDKNSSNFLDAMILGTRARFAQDPEFRRSLKALGSVNIKITEYDKNTNQELHKLFNQLRFSPEQVFYDDIYGPIPFERVNAVVAGVEAALMVNPNIPQLPFLELEKKYAAKNPTNRKELVMCINKLDEIVPVLKIKLSKKIFAEETLRFKQHLLDVTLSYLLDKHYPAVPQNQYFLAKYQQKQREHAKAIQTYEDKLYDLYTSGDFPANVARKLRWKPTIIKSDVVTVDAIEEIYQPVDINYSIQEAIDVPSTLLPAHPFNVTIKGETYPTVLAYAYSVLFSSINKPIDKSIDVKQLGRVFTETELEMVHTKLTKLNERATREKFSANSSLVELLLATKGNNLVLVDVDDEILGIGVYGPDGQTGKNRAGIFLQHLRDEYNKDNQPIVIIELVTPLDNIVVTTWFRSRIFDYANTMKLFIHKNSMYIEYIYSIVGEDSISLDTLNPEIKDLFASTGLTFDDQAFILPFVAKEFDNVRTKGIRGICEMYNDNKPTETDRTFAGHALGKMFNDLRGALLPEVDVYIFTVTILSNTPARAEVNQEQWWRVHKWAEIGRKMVIEQEQINS